MTIDIYVFTQVSDETTAVLTDSTLSDFAKGLLCLSTDPGLRKTLGPNTRVHIEKECFRESYRNKLGRAYLCVKYPTHINGVKQRKRSIYAASSASS
jgi:hypothetical protein